MELTLTQHELFTLPPGTPATGPAIRVEVTLSNQPSFFAKDRPSFFVLARLVKTHSDQDNGGHDYYRVFLRDEQKGEDEIFCGDDYVVVPKDSLSSEEMWQEAIEKRNLFPETRFWKAPDLAFCVALHDNGHGGILERPGPNELGDTFRWRGQEGEERGHFFEWNTQEFHQFCRELVLDPGSDLNFFLKWRRLSFDEKTTLSTQCKNGDWEQLVRLFSQGLLLVFHHFVMQPDERGSDVNVKWRGLSYRHKGDIGGWNWIEQITPFYTKKYPAYFYAGRLQEAIFQIVRPTFWLPPRPLCCYHWLQGHRWFDGENFVAGAKIEHAVEHGMPTLHEVMEAQLELREFFRPYLSEGEIEALFTP